MTLVLGFNNPVHVRDAAGGDLDERQFDGINSRSLLVGLSTNARIGTHNGKVDGVEVLLQPWAAFRLFGVAMHEVADSVADPEEVLGLRARRLAEALAPLSGWAERFALLDSVLSGWAAEGPTGSPRVAWAWNQLLRTDGMLPIHQLTEQTGWCSRQLNNRFREQIGLPPKTAARVLRLRRALRLLAAEFPLADIATRCGFSDQAHLNREFKSMIGCTPRQFLLIRESSVVSPADSVERIPGEATSVLLNI
ncbi:helix-turn-helix domain-containing protein [Nocardiopsis rhodophaea]|uniref:helix-turn-helix domain-containing protein n=1 Tax=Nocardiopsis rhodophaea TaxID=280238 RepID=UPI0031CF1844